MNDLAVKDIPESSSEVVVIDQQAQYMNLIELAVNQNADIEKLERLMDLQERWEQKNAKKAFFAAMSEFQSICPDIKKLKNGHNTMYAPLGDIVAQIREPLSRCGLSFRFEQDHQSGITVTCVINHVDGHSESTTMNAPADSSGKKNHIQAIASTVTYLSRYTLTSAFGITTADADIDGRLPEPEPDQGDFNFYPDDLFTKNFDKWVKAIKEGRISIDGVIAKIESKATLTDYQLQQIKSIGAEQ